MTITRPYTEEQVKKLQGSFQEEYKYSKFVANKFRSLLETEEFVPALGALTGNQAMQMAKAGLKAIYCSGWQVAADQNGQMYPDQSLYPSNAVPNLVRSINNTLRRADQIDFSEGKNTDYFLPIVADAEAGFGGPLNAFELMKSMIEAGAACVHFEDQLSSAKKCGHLGGKVLVPTSQFINTLVAARLATDTLNVPTLIIARTDANSARLLTSDIDDRDNSFLDGFDNKEFGRTSEGFYHITGGLDMAINRGLAYAPYADLLWCETSTPSIAEAEKFAAAIHEKFPGKWLAYNCSPSFNWKKHLSDQEITDFQKILGKLGFKFQFITLAGFHSLNHSMFDLAYSYKMAGMRKYAALQGQEIMDENFGFTATKHQREVGTGWFDLVTETITNSKEMSALDGSTESEQF